MPSDPALSPPLSYADATLPSRRVWPVVSTVLVWNVIVGVCLLLPVLRAERKAAVVPATRPAVTQPAATRPAASSREPVDAMTTIYGRYVVGFARSLPVDGGQVGQMLEQLETKTPEAKIAAAVVAGEVAGPDEAMRRLDAVDDPDARAFRAVYASAQTPSTGPSTRAATREATTAAAHDLSALYPRFGFFARLAESYRRPATDSLRADVLNKAAWTLYTLVIAFVVIAAAAVAGWVLFNTAVVLIVLGRLRFATPRPVGPAHVYGESSAIYLGGFIVASLVVLLLLRVLGLQQSLALQLVGLGGVMVVAALWPLVRGVRFDVLRRDWGVHGGRNPVVEVGCGVVGYLAGLPVLFAGAAVTALLLKLSQTEATHPIQNEIGTAPAWSLYLMAAVFAPLTEELLFRGALVSHLRAGLGVVASAVVSGVVFAAVHPQGWAAVPVLGAIGTVLALIRLWRGSLIASVTAHALNNAFVVTLLLLATR